MTTFKERIHLDLKNYLTGLDLVDKRLPECPDLDEIRNKLLETYLPDGVREFNAYPTVSLGWMMFLGMAWAEFWDKDWSRYAAEPRLYEQVRDARGYDCMDEYIIDEVLHLEADEARRTNDVVCECAARTLSNLRHASIEPGTPEAFHAYVDCLAEMYNFGAAIHLKRLGYHMTLID